jgi:ABC-type Mn2+/Zn2+ transport system ATPase subunit
MQVDLAGTERRSLTTLSGGQVQRVLLARALAQKADVLLLDEALSGVDAMHTNELIQLFTSLCAGGTSVLVSTHDLGLVRSQFSRCLTLNGGIVGDGSPSVELTGDRLDAVFSRVIKGAP